LLKDLREDISKKKRGIQKRKRNNDNSNANENGGDKKKMKQKRFLDISEYR